MDARDNVMPNATVGGLTELETSKVLRNTYMLLGMTLAFSAVMAFVSSLIGPVFTSPWLFLGGVFALSFLVQFTANSVWGLVSVFAMTGFIGFFIGPMIGALLSGGFASQVMMALSLTAVTFFGLSAYAIATKKDFSFMRGFIVVGLFVMLGAIILGLLFDLGAIQTAISAGIVLLMSCLILYQTSAIIHGGETNYILATTTLFMSIYNLFMSLLHLIMVFTGGDD
ncbi:MAG: Bax inhibitor-1/YccA family protein [Pseudomonadota bacterium]